MGIVMTDMVHSALRYRDELLSRAGRELGPFADRAEDIVQDAYLHLLRRVDDGQPPHTPRAWLHRVVHSLCRDERMRSQREEARDLEAVVAGTDLEQDALIRAESRWALAQVAALPAGERSALMSDLAGLRRDETGAPERSANAVYQALHRARRRLRAAHDAVWSALLPLRLWIWRLSEAATGAPVGLGLGGGLARLGGGLAGTVVVAAVVSAGAVGVGEAAMHALSTPPARAHTHARSLADITPPGAIGGAMVRHLGGSAGSLPAVARPARAPSTASGGDEGPSTTQIDTPSGDAQTAPDPSSFDGPVTDSPPTDQTSEDVLAPNELGTDTASSDVPPDQQPEGPATDTSTAGQPAADAPPPDAGSVSSADITSTTVDPPPDPGLLSAP